MSMKVVKGSSARGKQLIEMGSRYEGVSLHQVYDRWSSDKQEAYDYCYDQYLKSEEHEAFSICSHNSYSFTVSWLCVVDGENALRIETSRNSYVVLLDK